MPLVAAGLRDDVDEAAVGSAPLRPEAAGADLERVTVIRGVQLTTTDGKKIEDRFSLPAGLGTAYEIFGESTAGMTLRCSTSTSRWIQKPGSARSVAR